MTLKELLYKEEVYVIDRAAMQVDNTLGSGFLEAVYREFLEIELDKQNIQFKPQQAIIIYYGEKQLCSKYIADFLIYAKLLLRSRLFKTSQPENMLKLSII